MPLLRFSSFALFRLGPGSMFSPTRIISALLILIFLSDRADLVGAQLCGDTDGNGVVTVSDGVAVLRAAAQLSSQCELATCDVDRSGTITVTDGVAVLRDVAGLPNACDQTPRPTATPDGSIGNVIHGVVGGQEDVPPAGIAPPAGTLEVGIGIPPPTLQSVPTVAYLGVEATAVADASRCISVAPPESFGARVIASSRSFAAAAAAGSHLFVAIDGAEGFYDLPLAVDGTALVGVQFSNITSTQSIVLRLAIRTPTGDVTQYVPLNLTAAQPETPVSFVQFLPLGTLVDGFAIAPNDRHLYVGTFDGLKVLGRDLTTGSLTLVETDGSRAVADVAVSPDNATVYATGGSTLEVFARDPVSGKLTFIQQLSNNADGISGLEGTVGVLVSPDGKNVYVSGHQDSTVVIFSRNMNDGRLTFLNTVLLSQVTGQGGSFRATMTADGRFFYIPNFNNALLAYMRDGAGNLSLLQVVFNNTGGVTGLEGGFNARLSPDESSLYVAGFTKGTVAVFSRDTSSGMLHFQQNAQELYRTFSVAPGADGEFVYATTADSLAIFGHGQNGRLVLRGEVSERDGVQGVRGGRDIAISKDGGNVYIGDFGGDNGVGVFAVDSAS